MFAQCQGLGDGGPCGVGETAKRSRLYFFGGEVVGDDQNVLKWTVMVVSQLCEYTKNHFNGVIAWCVNSISVKMFKKERI